MRAGKPIASISLDLDNKWSYLKTHAEPGWETFPSYLGVVVPRVLSFLKRHDLRITFFIVGQDAALDENREALRSIALAGHEIGNHSFKHEPWLHLYTENEIQAELARAEDYIERATGQRPLGFRGPGFSLSPTVLRVLAQRGYKYDASTFPTFLGPLARLYYHLTARFSTDQLQERRQLFGRFRDGFRSLRPYRWRTDTGTLIEIPVTTMPVFRLPMHVSYLVYLGAHSAGLATCYFRTALAFCRTMGVQPSLLLHPTDFLGCDDTTDLAFFPGMKMSAEVKMRMVDEWIRMLAVDYDPVTMEQHAEVVAATAGLPIVTAGSPDLASLVFESASF